MNKRPGGMAILAAAVAAAAGLFASPSNSAQNSPTAPSCRIPNGCTVALRGTGPSPSTLRMGAGGVMDFANTDSAAHRVVFANGRCSLTLNPGDEGGPGVSVNGVGCKHDFPYYVGSYPYTVDGKFPGTVETTPWPSSVTLAARTHTIRPDKRLTLHGLLTAPYQTGDGPLPLQKVWRFPLIVLARHYGRHPFRRIATVLIPSWTKNVGQETVEYAWKLTVRPAVRTTYIAKSTGQIVLVNGTGHTPQGQFWAKARSRPLTVRIQH